MPSPFPGFDPYIESSGSWPDFHTDFLVGCREQLNRNLPKHYLAKLNERIQLVAEGPQGEIGSRVVIPDVAVKRVPDHAGGLGAAQGGVATLEPHVLPQPEWIDPLTEVFIEVVRLPEARVVTSIELLSPTNKRAGSADRITYLANRRALGHHQINLVELDFLAQGERIEMLRPLPAGDCFAFVTRADTRGRCDVYAWTYRNRLPTIPIPLRPEEQDIGLNLATVFDQTYERGGYDRGINYADPPEFLAPADRAWASQRIAAARA